MINKESIKKLQALKNQVIDIEVKIIGAIEIDKV